MDYEDYFTDYEKRLKDAILDGFLNNNFQPLYEYMYKSKGRDYANSWMLLGKKQKKLTCAELIVSTFSPTELNMPKVIQKAQKYIEKFKGKA